MVFASSGSVPSVATRIACAAFGLVLTSMADLHAERLATTKTRQPMASLIRT